MNRLVILLAGLVLTMAACTPGDDAASSATPTPTPSPATSSATPTPEPEPLPPVESLIISPGAIGPAEVGMTNEAALATGLFDDVAPTVADGCDEPFALSWKEEYAAAMDVYTDREGTITSLGVHTPGPHTAEGIGVGSTLGQLPYEAAEMTEAGFGQSGVFVSDGEQWLGFLFDESIEKVEKKSTVTFIEVTGSSKPALMRDGC